MGCKKDKDRWSTTHLSGEINGSHFSNKYSYQKKKQKKQNKTKTGPEALVEKNSNKDVSIP